MVDSALTLTYDNKRCRLALTCEVADTPTGVVMKVYSGNSH